MDNSTSGSSNNSNSNSTDGSNINESPGEALLASFVVNAFVGVALLLAFSILRTRPRFSPFYAANSHVPDSEGRSSPPAGFLGWIPETLRCPLEWIRVHRGVDALMYLRFLKMSFFLSLFFVLVGFAVIVPVNASGTNKDLDPSNDTYVTGINIINMGNIAQGSNLFWVHSVFTFIYVAVILAVLYHEYVQFIRNYLLYRSLDEQFNRSVMVSNLKFPSAFDGATNAEKESELMRKFNDLYPNEVSCVHIARHDPKLVDLRKKEVEFTNKLEHAELHLREEKKEPQHKINKKYGLWGGDLVDSIPYYRQQLSDVQRQIQERIEDPKTKLTPVAFVTFKNINTARACAQQKSIQYGEQISIALPVGGEEKKSLQFGGTKLDVVLGPQPADVNWNYLSYSNYEVYVRKLLALGIIVFLTFFWAIPVAFVQTLGNLRGLADTYPEVLGWLDDMLDFLGPTIENLINAYLPALLLVGLMAMVLPVFFLVTNQEGRRTLTVVNDRVSHRYFIFLLVNVFFVTTIAGTTLSSVVSSPNEIVDVLATTLPQQGDFYMNYILVKMSFVPMDILIFDIILMKRLKHFLAKTEREKAAADLPPPFRYAKRYAWDLLLMQITITYCMMNSMMAVFSMSYYALAYLCYKYGIIYIYRPESLSGGVLWKNTYDHVTVSLYTFTLTMIGLFALGGSTAYILVIVCVCLLTVAVILLNRQFARLERVAPRHDDDVSVNSDDGASPLLLSVPGKLNRLIDHHIFSRTPHGKPAIAESGVDGVDESQYYREPWMVSELEEDIVVGGRPLKHTDDSSPESETATTSVRHAT